MRRSSEATNDPESIVESPQFIQDCCVMLSQKDASVETLQTRRLTSAEFEFRFGRDRVAFI